MLYFLSMSHLISITDSNTNAHVNLQAQRKFDPFCVSLFKWASG